LSDRGTGPTFAWMGWGNPQNSVAIFGVPAEIWTGSFQYTG